MAALLACLVLAFVLGFAAHRASICTVRAVAEVMHARTAYMAASIAKTVLWIVLATLPFFWLLQPAGPYFGGWQITVAAVLGGLLFGLGAGVNGACAYSTMTRLVDGDGRMALTVAGFAAGVFGFLEFAGRGWIDRPVPAPTRVDLLVAWAPFLLVGLGVLAAVEAVRLWRSRPTGARLRDLVCARQYRLSTAALVIGLSGAAIYLLFGSAGYSTTFELVVEAALGARDWPAGARWLILLAVLAGMLASPIERRSFRPDRRPRRNWLRHLAGGALMGLGVALAPGGNDALVLYGLPTLSPHALPAFAAMAAGILAGLAAMRFLFGIEMRVTCRNDLYVSG